MGSNSSKNSNSNSNLEIDQQPEQTITEISTPVSKPINKNNLVDEDPRSPTLNNRTPLSSPGAPRSWRSIASAQKEDPRSPGMLRTPARKAVLPSLLPEDPRSPSITRTPIADADSTVVSSPYIAGRAMAMSVSMEEVPAPVEEVVETAKEVVTEERIEAVEPEEAEEDQSKRRQDGASVLDTSMQLGNSDNSISNEDSFQATAMQSIEIINPQAANDSEDKKKEVVVRKRKKDNKRESYSSSPLKKSYPSPSKNDSENVRASSQAQKLSSPRAPRSPLSTISHNRGASLSHMEKTKLNMNSFTENVPPVILG